jgi:hypothetical protein
VYAIAQLKFTDRDETTFRAWAGSPVSQEISRDRRAAADCGVLLVQGLA